MTRRIPASVATAAAMATVVAIVAFGAASEPLRAQGNNQCAGLPTYSELKEKVDRSLVQYNLHWHEPWIR